jgi:eukaryotic-like serine/threonine-protein kinase
VTLQTLARYQIQGEIGRGMMGVVYRALDPALGRVVALKTVQSVFPLPPEQQKAFEERFLAEARVAAGLSHPAIVTVHDVGRDSESGTLFIAFEYLQGQTLAELTATGALEWREAFRIAGRLAEGLQHAHARGVVHRDIKPGNVMVLPTGDPKIMDFGIAKLTSSQLTAAGEFFGTPSYMSPEQALGESVDGRSDIFSLGSVTYLMLTGMKAFDAASVPAVLNNVARNEPPPPSRFAPGLPADVDVIVMRALAKRPSERYPDGRTMAEDIEDALAGRPLRHRLTQLPERAGSPAGALALDKVAPPAPPPSGAAWGRREVLALVGLGLAAAVALLMVAGRPPSPTAPTAGSPAAGIPPAAPTPVPSPAHVTLTLDHPFKRGTMKVWIDDQGVLEEPLESRVTKKLLVFKSRQGKEEASLDVPAGSHSVRVQVEGDGVTLNRRLKTFFRGGETRRLQARVDGKQLVLEWVAAGRP